MRPSPNPVTRLLWRYIPTLLQTCERIGGYGFTRFTGFFKGSHAREKCCARVGMVRGTSQHFPRMRGDWIRNRVTLVTINYSAVTTVTGGVT